MSYQRLWRPCDQCMIESISRVVTLIVTNIIKLTGVYLGARELIVHNGTNAIDLAYSAFLIAGGQFSETTVLAFIERFFDIKTTPTAKEE